MFDRVKRSSGEAPSYILTTEAVRQRPLAIFAPRRSKHGRRQTARGRKRSTTWRLQAQRRVAKARWARLDNSTCECWLDPQP